MGLKASEEGKRKIWKALADKGLQRTSKETLNRIESELYYISDKTWKRFVYAERPIRDKTFKDCCEFLGLNSEEIVDSSQPSQPSKYDWDSAPSAEIYFYGRDEDMKKLEKWVLDEHYRWIILYGFGGIGKTQLAVKLAEQVEKQNKFDKLIWQQISYSTPKDQLVSELLDRLLPNSEQIISNVEKKFLEELKRQKILIILNEHELFEKEEQANDNRDSYKHYCNFLRQLSWERHQSCIILTTREKPNNLDAVTSFVKAHELKGLDVNAGCQLLSDGIGYPKNLTSDEQARKELVHRYDGNPLALKLVAGLIREHYSNERKFVDIHNKSLVVPEEIETILASVTKDLNTFQKKILCYLAKVSDPISRDELDSNLPNGMHGSELPRVLETLKQRSLILLVQVSESNEYFYTLQPMVRKFVLRQLT
ncbi:WD-repeat protein [Tolypothrix tenuis PCC 7101]|uniref:WD-repeat protein n=1 Tax=Tolypothrix tenuis PCC 7101 TaxID=231146 RepID=A0A1Z4N3N2_9CYAN|nr:AAA family ATPase [Aulosira sp. FACHB-113]BAY28758.1 WD-repeat protein [Nostoc carneum NIES-2107]BAZ00291.1 WD-repeat protein [Tolypothrix tenuis PCC 7101]BAZ75788.1 WD-repeat protein [Aulosira laxa NIES-50]